MKINGARGIVVVLVALSIAAAIAAAVVCPVISDHLEDRGEFQQEIALIKGERTEVPGTSYYLQLKEVTPFDTLDGEAIIALYNGSNLVGQKLIRVDQGARIGEFKIYLEHFEGTRSEDHDPEYVSLDLYI